MNNQMTVFGINRIHNWVSVISGGRTYTCPTKMVDGELFFEFKRSLHKVNDFTSEYTMESVSEGGKILYRKLKQATGCSVHII